MGTIAASDHAPFADELVFGYAEIDGVPARVLPEGDKPAQLTRSVHYDEVRAAN